MHFVIYFTKYSFAARLLEKDNIVAQSMTNFALIKYFWNEKSKKLGMTHNITLWRLGATQNNISINLNTLVLQ